MKKEFFIPSLMHLFVDFFSVFALTCYYVDEKNFPLAIIIYGILAFITQPVIGALIENSKNIKNLVTISCFITLLGAATYNMYSVAIICGIGNALFHVSAGELIISKAKESSPLGVFISFGAIGVGLGLLNYPAIIRILAVVLSFVFVGIIILHQFTSYSNNDYLFKEEYKEKNEASSLLLPLILIVISVLLRGFFGRYSNYTWTIQNMIIYIQLSAFFGKFIGGFILDKFGPVFLISISTFLSLTCLFFQDNMYSSLLGIIGVNLLMALTMDYMRKSIPKYTAFGFGLLAAFLCCGTYLGFLIQNITFYNLIISLVLLIINSVLLVVSLILLKKKGRV